MQKRLTLECPGLMDTSTTQCMHLRGHHRRGTRNIVQAREMGSLPWDFVSQKLQGSYILSISTIGLPKQDLNNDNTHWHVIMERGNLTESRSLDKELQESKGCWQRENKSFPRMSLLTGPFSTKWSALQSYTYKQNLMDTASVFIYLYIYVSVTIPIRNHEMERGEAWKVSDEGEGRVEMM